MDDVLKVSAIFDAAPIANGMETAASSTAAATGSMSAAFTALEAQVAELEAQIATLEARLGTASNAMGGFDRAAAMAGGRLAGMEAGIGMAGGALGRLAAFLPGLGLAFELALPIALIAMAISGIENLEKAGLKLADADHAVAEASAKQNDELMKLDEEYTRLTQGSVAGYLQQLKDIPRESLNVTNETKALTAQLEQETHWYTNLEAVLQRVMTMQGAAEAGLDLNIKPSAYTANDAEKAITLINDQISKNQDLKAAVIAINEEIAKATALRADEVSLDQARTDLGIKALEIERAYLTTQQEIVDKKEANKKITADEDAFNLHEKMMEQQFADMQREASEELRAIEARKRLEEEADRTLAEEEKKNLAEKLREIREAEEAMMKASEAEINSDAEAFHAKQEQFRQELENIKQKEKLATAGMKAGPIKEVVGDFDEEKMAVAQKALAATNEEVTRLATKLQALSVAQSLVDQNTKEGVKEYEDFDRQIRQIQKELDGASTSAGKWRIAMQNLTIEQKTNANNFQTAWVNAIQNTTNAFNSSFIAWVDHGGRAMHILASMGEQMANTLIMWALKETEVKIAQWVMQSIFKKTTAATDAAATIAATKAEGVAQAGVAGAAGVASWAAAPWPIDMGAPAFGAAMFSTALGYAAFEGGGIVPETNMALVHKNEMVLPANISQSVQEMTRNGGSRAGSGDVHMHYAPTVHAMDAAGMDRVLAEHGDKMAMSMMKIIRMRNR